MGVFGVGSALGTAAVGYYAAGSFLPISDKLIQIIVNNNKLPMHCLQIACKNSDLLMLKHEFDLKRYKSAGKFCYNSTNVKSFSVGQMFALNDHAVQLRNQVIVDGKISFFAPAAQGL